MDLVSLFTNIADAIRGKKGTEDKIRAVDFASEIESIETGGGSSGLISKDVDFIDYDGTLLYSYTLEEIQAMTELPPLPTQEGLICQEWNWNLEDIKAHNRRLIVGATYITDDGKTRLYIELDNEEYLTMPIVFGQSKTNAVEIDWGDGSPIETFSSSFSSSKLQIYHTYSSVGRYIITFNPADDCDLIFGNQYHSCNVVGSSSTSAYTSNLRYYSNKIFKVHFGKNVELNNQRSFEYCRNLTEIIVPKGSIRIGDSFFRECGSLNAVIIPSSVKELTNTIFYNCVNLKTISLPNGINATNSEIFIYCKSLKVLTVPDSFTNIATNLCMYCDSLSEFIIPNAVTTIGNAAFTKCSMLKSIIIPNTVTSLGNSTFSGCWRIEKIILPNSVSSVGSSIFNECDNLKTVVLSEKLSAIPNSMFYKCHNLQSIDIPEGVTDIGSQAFYECRSLQNVNVPNGVQIIKQNAFLNCNSLLEINLPESVTNIEYGAFQYCYSLSKITMSSNITSIGSSAFSCCYSLLEIFIPSGVSVLNSSVFTSCLNMKKYDFSEHTQVPTLENTNAFQSIPKDCKIIVPDALYEEWISATNWSNYASYIIKASEVA